MLKLNRGVQCIEACIVFRKLHDQWQKKPHYLLNVLAETGWLDCEECSVCLISQKFLLVLGE